ncbi:hypothetical protein [Nitrosomonas sp.]|uniref:hypothetical protein n=1 Tax=Nitrosomonas sp. TaxID=42353 RepID=UPI001DD2BED3|nr:hypothetical protein [Nitrosomonas sp.]MBX3615842.1 hypothetical protein [Nitrosomonas sp.]
MSFVDPTGEIALSASGAVLGAILDISIQSALNGGRIECVKLESVSIAAAAGALNPFALGRAMVTVNKANRQLQRAYALRAGSRAVKRTEFRSDKNRAAAIKELGSWAVIELGAEGLGNLIPNDKHVRIGNIFGNSSLQCECR